MIDKKKTIAVIRGGEDDYFRSMRNGANAILSLLRYSDLVDVVDVSIDEGNHWFEKGVPSDPHKVFSKVDFYIDFTNNKYSDYHDLSNKLNVKSIFRNDYVSALNRGNIKRILSQLDINVPRYIILRDKKNLEYDLKDIWLKFQMPLVIKEAQHEFNEKSILTYSFIEAYEKLKKILEKSGEAVVEEYIQGKYISVAVVPEYRGEELYIPTPVEVLNFDFRNQNLNSKSLQEKCLIGHNCEKKSLIFIGDSVKNNIKSLAKEIHKSLFLNNHSMVDMVLVENKKLGKGSYTLKVLDVHTSPQLFEDSRFDFILKNSGVDLGRFIIDRLEKLKEEELSY